MFWYKMVQMVGFSGGKMGARGFLVRIPTNWGFLDKKWGEFFFGKNWYKLGGLLVQNQGFFWPKLGFFLVRSSHTEVRQ